MDKMDSCESQFGSMSEKLWKQELRIMNKALEDLKKDYEQLKIREQTLLEKTRWEQGRTKAQEDKVIVLKDEIDKLKENIERVTKERDCLQKEVANLRRRSTENSCRAKYESDIIDYRAKIAGLESRLSRRQSEFERSEESMRDEINNLRQLLNNTENRFETSVNTFEKENLSSQSIEKMNDLSYKVGDLTATNKGLREEITRHISEKAELNQEIRNLREEVESQKGENKVLQARLTETEGSNDFASKYYNDEITKIKQQKTDLRMELIKLRREHEKCLQEKGKEDNSKEKYEKEVSELKNKVSELQIKLVEAKRNAAEMESSENGKIQQLMDDLKKANASIALNQEALQNLDKQAEDLVKRVQAEYTGRKAAKRKIVELEAEIKELNKTTGSTRMMEEEIASLKAENDKLIDKVAYLQNEIRETHTDHREELAKLAKQITTTRATAPSEDKKPSTSVALRVSELETTIRQNENVSRSMQRQIDQAKAENVAAEKSLFDMREKQCIIVKENTELRQALHDAINKIKSYKESEEKLTKANVENLESIEKLELDIINLKDQISQLHDEIQQKDENIAYLQSIQQPRKLEKLKITNSQSTLVTGGDDESEFEQLMAKRDELAREVTERMKILEKKKEEIVPLLKAGSGASIEVSQTSSPSSSRSRIGTMRHEIPHRFSKTFLVMISPRCESCYEAVTRFSYALRCKACHLVVHPHCEAAVRNTCGLPSACANFYVENHTVTQDRMSGWVKIWKSSETKSGEKWFNAFASLEGNTLAFYETDIALAQSDAPILTVDLSQERWRIYNQTGHIQGIQADNAECLIEIKLQDTSLFMLTQTPAAKRSWIQALQSATNRRILDRNGSHRRVMSCSVIVRMGHPFLKFQCTEVYHDWLLMGTPQGLFVTNLSSTRMPFQIAGFTNVFQMKWIKEHNLFFAIDGIEQNVVVLPVIQLDNALSASTSPRVQPTSYSNLPAAHLIELGEPDHNGKRYLYIATASGIFVFHYVAKRDMFLPLADIPLEIPAMCIVSYRDGFVFGSDTFYYVSHETMAPASFRTDWPPDCPIGVVKISDEEILIVNHNCGVFTTPQGKRTRPGNVEWDRVPISVTYCEPYLFIVYTDMISIARVSSYEEVQNGSPLIEEMEGYRAPSARVTGYGKNPSEILVTVTNDKCVELNCFSSSSSKASLKRKITSVSSMQSVKKRL